MEYKEGMTYKDFIASKRKRGNGRRNSDFSVEDYYKHYRHSVWRYQGGFTKLGKRRKRMAKNGKWTITKPTFRKILTSINSLLLETIIKGQDVELPVNFGILYARQKEIYTRFEDGKIKTNRAIDWNATTNLWYEDKEAREGKQVVYQNNIKAKPYLRIQFGDFANKRFLDFAPLHPFMRELTRQMRDNNVILPPQGTSVKAIKDISYDREYSIH